MKIEHPNALELTAEEQQELTRLKALIEKAIADGVLSSSEAQNIKAAVLANKPSSELLYQELQLYRQLVTEKVKQGLVVAEHFE
ncbi:MAG: hypothetical protein VKJ02_17670 [Snowella sp.]|nr:hypothetical protein [Snowella sp.]